MTKNVLRPAFSAFLLMLTMSLMSTGLSFFVAPVCADLGFGRGSFTLYYSLIVAAGAISASFLGSWMNKHGARGVILLSALWCGAGFFGFSFSSSLWMFYLLGACMGLLGSTCLYLAANVIVQQSCSSQGASAVLGLVMAGSGIGGVIWSNVVPVVLEGFGWRFSYRVVGILWIVLPILAALLLGRQEMTGAFGNGVSISGGMSKKDALKSSKFYLATAVMCIISCASCVSQQLPALLDSLGHSNASTLISLMTAFVAVGTILEGLICSKLGIKYTMLSMLVIYAVGFLLLAFNSNVYLALVCLAFGSGSIGTLMPIVVRTIFGGREYAAIWSVVISCSSIASFLATPVWGMVYDMSGSYLIALIVMPVMLVVSVVCLLGAFKK